MVFLNILFGLGLVLVAAVTAVICFNQCQPLRIDNRRDEDDPEIVKRASPKGESRQKKTQRSVAGDKCAVCLEEMRSGDMHFMKCEHALHKACHEEYRCINKNCPKCDQLVNPHLPGELCAICRESMDKSNMKYLRCQHALHHKCHQQLIQKGDNRCPHCRE